MSNEFQVDSWNDYIGQPLLKERLAIHIASANERDVAMEHVLLVGPPGCLAGNTTISVNRAGKGFQVSLSEFVRRFHGGPTSGRIWESHIPTKVQFSDGEVIRLGLVKDCWESGIKTTYTLLTDSGRSIRATAIHPFLTKEGWVNLGDLNVGDCVQVNSGRSNKDYVKIRYADTYTKFHPSQRAAKDGFRYITHRLVMEASLNSLTFDEYIWILRNDETRSKSFRFLNSDELVHHRDGNPKNNDLSNLELTDNDSHHEHHNWANNVLEQAGYEQIVSIDVFGEEMTYDIEMVNEPHNFIANGFVVHNSGKTSISRIIADELYVDFADYVMPIKPAVIKRICHTHYGVVLFDEIHRCSAKQQEELLTLVQGNYYQTDSGVTIEAPNLTIIGATTEPDKIIAPLYDRFAIKPMFEEYSDEEMALIACGMAHKAGVELTNEQLLVIGTAAGGVPRNAKSMIVMARDLKIAKGDIDIREVLRRCNVTPSGLTDNHLDYLRVLAKNSPSGVDIICAQMRLPKSVVLDLERLLVRRDLMHYTKQGREILSNGYKSLKMATKGK